MKRITYGDIGLAGGDSIYTGFNIVNDAGGGLPGLIYRGSK